MTCGRFAMSSGAVRVISTTVPVAPRSCAVAYLLVLVVSSTAEVRRALVQVESSMVEVTAASAAVARSM
jgi:hypothetical protein